MKFADELRFARAQLSLMQKELAKKIKVSCATICRWENENREPKPESKERFYAFCEQNGIKFEE